MQFKLGILGCGNMGKAIAARLLKNNFPAHQLYVHDVHHDKITDLLQTGCQTLHSDQWTTQVETLILAVKPQSLTETLSALAKHHERECLVISIAAGASLKTLSKPFTQPIPIIRAMPNTPALVGRGITALIRNAHVTPEHRAQADLIFNALGSTLWMEHEDEMDAVTALSGSGPAYLFALIEAMEKAGVRLGLKPEQAAELARETGIGAMELLRATLKTPRELLQQVCSKGGTTEAALTELTDANLNEILYRSMYAAYQRAKKFS